MESLFTSVSNKRDEFVFICHEICDENSKQENFIGTFRSMLFWTERKW